MWFVILLGIIAFFIFEMPVVFFLVVLPLSLLISRFYRMVKEINHKAHI